MISPKSISLSAAVSIEPNAATVLAATAYVDPDTDPGAEIVGEPDWELAGNTYALDSAGVTQAIARGIIQESRLEVYVDGALVPASQIIGPITVDRSRDRAIQTWSFGTCVDPETGMGPFGNPIGQLGTPLGKRKVSIYAAYKAGKVYRFPLLVNGICHSYFGPSTRLEHLETHTGVDEMGCLSRTLVDYVRAQGQRIPRHEAIRSMLLQAGASNFALSPMRRTNKPLQYVEADPVAASQELCEVEGRQIQQGPGGEIRNPLLRGAGAAQWTIRESDLLSFELTAPGDVITRVVVNGTTYVAAEEEEEPSCPALLSTQTQSTDTIYSTKILKYRQEGNCSITDLGSLPREEKLMRTSKVIIRTVTRCGVIVLVEVETWGWYAAEDVRYERNPTTPTELRCSDGVSIPRKLFLNNSDPSANGSQPAHREAEKWRVVNKSVVRYFYNLDGWYDGSMGFSLDVNASVGAYLGSFTEERAFYFPKAAVKTKPAIFDGNWGAIDYNDNTFFRGGGEGVSATANLNRDAMRIVRREIARVHSNKLKEKERETVDLYTWAVKPGSQYLYGDGRTYNDPTESLQRVATEGVLYLGLGESSHQTVTTFKDLIDPSRNSVDSKVADGSRPFVDILPFIDEEVVEVDGEIPEEELSAAIGRHGEANENQAFSTPVTSTQLESRHCANRSVISLPMVEDEQEAAEYGKLVIAESSALIVSLEVPLNGVMDETDAATLTFRPRGIVNKRLEFRSLNHQFSDRYTMPTTRITGRIYL